MLLGIEVNMLISVVEGRSKSEGREGCYVKRGAEQMPIASIGYAEESPIPGPAHPSVESGAAGG